MSSSSWVTTPLWLSKSLRSFLYSSSVYSCHLLLISSASVRSLHFLFFIVPILAWNVPLISPVSVRRSLVFPILLFSSISLPRSFQKNSPLILVSSLLLLKSVVNFLSLASPGSIGQPTILSSKKPILLPAPRWPPSHSSASAPPTFFSWSLLTQVPTPSPCTASLSASRSWQSHQIPGDPQRYALAQPSPLNPGLLPAWHCCLHQLDVTAQRVHSQSLDVPHRPPCWVFPFLVKETPVLPETWVRNLGVLPASSYSFIPQLWYQMPKLCWFSLQNRCRLERFSAPPVATMVVQAIIVSPLNDSRSLIPGLLLPVLSLVSLFTQARGCFPSYGR